MSKKDKLTGGVASHPEMQSNGDHDPMAAMAAEAVGTTEDAPKEKKAAPIGTRGPKGAALDAVITLFANRNPKREGSKAYRIFSLYRDGMTVQEFLDVAKEDGTPNLVYDHKHGFIGISGYEAPVLTPKAPREKKPPKPKKEKVAKETSEIPTPMTDVHEETVVMDA